MLNAIVNFSIRFKGVIIALACLLLGYGSYTLTQAKYDVFPEFAPPQVVIQTEAPGLSPEQVELLVTQPIENTIRGVTGLESLRSSSIQGLSIITVTFQPSANIFLNRQLVSERLTSLSGQFPEGVQAPIMTPLTTSTSVIYVLGLTSEKLSQKNSLMDLKTFTEWTLKPRLLSIPGVAKAVVFGGETQQFQIQIHPDKLIPYNLSIEDILIAARRATGIRGAGFIDTGKKRILLQTEGQSLNVQDLERTSLVQNIGNDLKLNLKLGDVAEVKKAPEPAVGAAAIMGEPGIQVVISSQLGSNTLEVTKKIEEALEELHSTLETKGVILHSDIFRPANFIQTALQNIRNSLILGAILVIVILFLFLLNFRIAAISCTAIPLSLLAAVTVLNALGISLNTMTLGGLAIAIGEVVDDAIIDVENILRRLRENRELENPKNPFQVVLSASLEVRGAVVFATLSVVLVFFPVLTLPGVAGRLFAPLGIAYIFAVLASLLVALTVTPALCLLFLPESDLSEREPTFIRQLKKKYHTCLLQVERFPRTVIVVMLLLTGAGLGILPFFGGEYLPELREGHFIIHMAAEPGTSLQESLRIGKEVTLELLKLPYIRSVAQRAGRAEKADDTWGTHYSELDVNLKNLSEEESKHAEEEIRKSLSQFSGIHFSVETFLTERVEETLSGYTAALAIRLFGNDSEVLGAKAQELVKVLREVPGSTDVIIQSPPGTPMIAIKLKKEALAYWGFDPVEVLDVIRTAYQGSPVGQVYEGNRVFEVAVILDPKARGSIQDIEALRLRSPTGTYVKLSQLAEVKETLGRDTILHEGGRRVQTITCNVQGRDTKSFLKEAKAKIASHITFPPGTYPEFTGTAEAQARSTRDLIVHSLMTGIGILLLLSIVLGHWRNLLLVLANLPFALVGGILAILVTERELSMGSMVGFVTLFGISLRNSIMMISHYEHLVSKEGMTWGVEAAIRGARERLVPILMTASVAALGLLPLAIGSGNAGREIEGPMAIVILGGLVTSTILNLLILPTLALRFGKFGKME